MSHEKKPEDAAILRALAGAGLSATARLRFWDETALMVACRWGDAAAAKLLLDRGADPNTSRASKGACKHPSLEVELESLGSVFKRCPACGLAAISSGGHWRDMTACGVCARFDCACPRR